MALTNCSAQTQFVSTITTETFTNLGSIEWIHGSQNCEAATRDSTYQQWQQIQYQENTFIFRQNKCSHYEGPFVYLFVGSNKGLLIDSGATVAGGQSLLESVRKITDLPLLVAHTHGHSDHRLGDGAFQNHEKITVVEIGANAVQKYFGFENWPNDPATIELGGRQIQLLPIPGHSDDDLAFYDQLSQIVVTGDTLYPGRLYVRDWSEYRNSILRLGEWVQQKPVSFVLGTHIEMSNTPNEDYPVGTTFQPDEHQLPLGVRDIYVLRESLEKSESPEKIPLGSYIVWPI
jgi:glyoxylase-like metal-dependent hydrolase (beta-lactamase superfamily II)